MSDVREAIDKLLRPRTVAVIGASRNPRKIGHQVVKNLLEAGFPRNCVFPVNPNADEVLGLKCYPSVRDVPVPIDLAVIAIPAALVPKVLEDCGEKGVRAVAIITSGFKEVGNVKAERELVEIARKYGFRILGPNIVGICDTVKRVNASFCQGLPLKGRIAFITQSGALAIALVGWTQLKGVGLSDLVSLGNKADLNEADFVEYFGQDPHTKVITAYLEGIEDGRRFMEVASKVSPIKPIIVLKAGRAERALGAIRSHTGSLAGSDAVVDAALEQCGVIRAPTFIELFDWAVALAELPLPKGENVVIVTNGGGAGVMATDAAEAYGVKLMDIPPDLAERLRRYMPPFGSTFNPVDLTGMATKEWYKGAILELLKDNRVHAIAVLYCHTAVTHPREIADAILEARREAGVEKPIVASLIGGEECLNEIERLTSEGVPSYESPEKAMAALGALFRYKRLRDKLLRPRTYPEVKADVELARSVIEKALSEGRSALTPLEAAQVAKAYGIPVLEKRLTKTPEEAVKAAEEVGYPVVLEVESPQVIHKTEVGGIILDLKSGEEVAEAFRRIVENVKSRVPEAEIKGVIVRRMAPKGVEVLIGMHRDPSFGPVIAFGSGGVLVELIRDVTFRVAPISLEEAREMVESTRIYRVLRGFRDQPECDVEAVVDVLLRVSRLAMDLPEVSDVDINPFFVYEKGRGGMAIDVKILLRKA
ncbi:MAG: acetate--CoA ligase family protein [Thermoproteales archaeon]|nr:acetate--CoA ligase family protein [Thermoproteales archaeon]